MFNRMIHTLGVCTHKFALAQRLQESRLATASNDTSDGPALVKAHVSIADGKWYRRRNKLHSVHFSQ